MLRPHKSWEKAAYVLVEDFDINFVNVDHHAASQDIVDIIHYWPRVRDTLFVHRVGISVLPV